MPAELQALGPELGMTDEAMARATQTGSRIRFRRFSSSFFNYAVIAIFLAAICAPLLGRWSGLASPPSVASELRIPAKMPAMQLSAESLAAFPAAYEAYFNDSFGFRNELLYGYALAKVMGLRESSAEQVIVGRNGWLFFDARYVDGTDPIADVRGTRPLTNPQLEQALARFTGRRNWLAERGIAYVLLVAPNKETIYPEFLPAGLEPLGRPSPLDQLKPRLLAASVELVDVRDDYALAKQQSEVFYKTDTHWNWEGAMLAYKRLMEAVQRQLPAVDRALLEPLPLSEYDTRQVSGPGMGLANMLGLADRLREESMAFSRRSPPRAKVSVLDERKTYVTCTVDDGRLPRAVMLHDSYSAALIPFVAEHFSRLVCHRTAHFDAALIDLERPAVVIEEVGERGLRLFGGDNPRGVDIGETPSASGPTKESPAVVPPAAKSNPPVQPSSPRATDVAQPDMDDLCQRFDSSADVCFVWTPADASQLKLTRQLGSLRIANDNSLAMTSTGNDPQLLLPAVESTLKKPWVVRIEISTPATTQLQLFWRTPGRSFSPGRTVLRSMREGRNVVFIQLDDPEASGPLRLDPGTVAGQYALHSVEIRACPGR